MPGTEHSSRLSVSLTELNTGSDAPEILPEGQEWPDRRALIESVWRDFIGVLDEPGTGDLTVREKSREDGEAFERWSVQIDGGDIGPIPAHLLVPDGALTAATGTIPAPAMIACHPTNPDGQAAITTESGEGRRPYGLELARRGYVVIAPDCLSAGERIYDGHKAYRTSPFYREHPDRTIVARNISDHQSALNALCQLPFVDADRIGAIGHSLGGYNAYFLAGLDPRVRAVVSSCGFGPFRHDPRPGRWGRRDWYTHLPAITDELEQGRVPFDFGQIAALVAPRPFFHYFGQTDAIFPHWQAISEALQGIRQLYDSLGHVQRFEMLMGGGSHDFPAEIRQLSYQFLDHWLDASDPSGASASVGDG
ncbi:dienelactone hydrolase family protein [Ruania zhangjianzhongii]|uniref:dienelactone hydrolase family protein n=1 Tax=Ruania zhangjianzhongii TaxID=2603206 RepID=UPI0011CC6EA1|nr:dienelactone hydrolase family protein [Ruania zhangjianzhongii]